MRARNTERPIQLVITKQHQQLTNGAQDGQYGTKKQNNQGPYGTTSTKV